MSLSSSISNETAPPFKNTNVGRINSLKKVFEPNQSQNKANAKLPSSNRYQVQQNKQKNSTTSGENRLQALKAAVDQPWLQNSKRVSSPVNSTLKTI